MFDLLKTIVVVLCAACCLTACSRRDKSSDSAAPTFIESGGLIMVPSDSPLRTHLVVSTVDAGNEARVIELPAAVEADPARVVNVLAPLTGRVIALDVGLGDRVKRGQILAVIASGDFDQARADDEKARDAFELARKALKRARGVREAGGTADKDLEAAKSAFVQAQAELTRAHARLLSLDGTSNRSRELTLSAPQDGAITALSIAPGAQVNDPTATLMTVTNIDTVFITANVAENNVGDVVAGMDAEVSLTAYPERILHGKVAEVNATLEPDTRRQKVRIIVRNPDGRLMPNMYATVKLKVHSAEGVVVPQSALLMNNDAISVLVEVRPWVFARRPVQILDETDTIARITGGPKAGDRVVVKGGVLLND